MSGYVTGWVLKHSEARGATRLVLIVLADHAGSDGTNAWPTVETIQHEARLGSRGTVQKALRDLEADGAIIKAGTVGRGQSNWTVLTTEGPDLEAPGGPDLTTEGPDLEAPGARSASSLARAHDSVVQPSINRPQPSGGGEVEGVWEHYVAVMKPRRTEVDAGGRALIREALKVATAIECKRAIDGCRASAFHMGENDGGKKYNQLGQILKGKRGGRSTREQIDFFLDIAERTGAGDGDASVDQARLDQAKRNVLTAWEFPGSELAKKNGEMSVAWLAQHGYRVVSDDSGRPTFERATE